MSEREELAEALGCEFNPWGECQTHETPSDPRGYDEHYCSAVESVMEWLERAHDDRIRAEERARWGLTEKHDGPHACLSCGMVRAVKPLADMSRNMRAAAALRAAAGTPTHHTTEEETP